MFAKVFPAALGAMFLGISFISVAHGTPANENVLFDFEGRDYSGWELKGNAFGSVPSEGTLPGQQAVSGFEGRRLANSFHEGDKTTGLLRSPEFTIDRPFINVLVGGGNHPQKTGVRLIVEGKVVASVTGTATTGSDDEHLSWRSWDVNDFKGKKARIELFDDATGGWGHINVDQVTESDSPRQEIFLNEPITSAMSSVRGAAARAAADPLRPAFHLMPPALWCNDPNGPIYFDGWYHVFYQHNPYGDRWEHMHWGHARSQDLVHWEHLPIALWPSTEKGENHCFSGSAALNGDGKVMLFYTSIGPRLPEQWAAIAGDSNLITWSKLTTNPILSEKIHGKQKIDEWRDPYVFEGDDKRWMVCGGHPHGQKGGIMLYEALDGTLAKWEYRGVPFQGKEDNWECPNLFKVGNNWVLLYSPHSRVRYYTGSLNLKEFKFTPRHEGFVDHGNDFYATSAFVDPSGRWLIWAWIRNFPGGRGWNGCLSLPRVVKVANDGRLLQAPAQELEGLRLPNPLRLQNVTLDDRTKSLDFSGRQIEIVAEIELGNAQRCGLKVLKSTESKDTPTLFVDAKGIEVAGERADFEVPKDMPVNLRIFVDRSVLEVFINDERCLTKVVNAPVDGEFIELFATGGKGTFKSLDVYRLSVH
ncbi:glycoside hydrolase family 32 protein [bacterium]|nr:glycoside hydrolase family 32 protein [bacterium]